MILEQYWLTQTLRLTKNQAILCLGISTQRYLWFCVIFVIMSHVFVFQNLDKLKMIYKVSHHYVYIVVGCSEAGQDGGVCECGHGGVPVQR